MLLPFHQVTVTIHNQLTPDQQLLGMPLLPLLKVWLLHLCAPILLIVNYVHRMLTHCGTTQQCDIHEEGIRLSLWPILSLSLDVCPCREEYILTVHHHIFTLVAIYLLTFWCVWPVVIQFLHPRLCCGKTNWFFHVHMSSHFWCIHEFNKIHCSDKFTYTLQVCMNFLHKSCIFINHWPSVHMD